MSFIMLQTLKDALVAAKDDHPGLERLLFGRLLPVLVSSRELMTVEELAWAVGESDVEKASTRGVLKGQYASSLPRAVLMRSCGG